MRRVLGVALTAAWPGALTLVIESTHSDSGVQWRSGAFDDESNLWYNYTEWEDFRGWVPELTAVGTHRSVTEVVREVPKSSGAGNLCMDGHLVPEYFLIGVIKAATTSFAADLGRSTSMVYASANRTRNKKGFKELHYFDAHYLQGRQWFLSFYPPCRQGMRVVAAEQSPRYFVDPVVPYRIRDTYGSLAPKLTFLVMLREPIARIHSDFYDALEKGWCGAKINQRVSFQRWVDSITGLMGWMRRELYVGGFGNCSDRLEATQYPKSFKYWFQIFNSSQFIVAPTLFSTEPRGRANQTLVSAMWKRLGVPRGNGYTEEPKQNTHLNSHDHRPLEEDITPASLERFRKWVYSVSGPDKVAAVLANSNAELYEYKQGRNDKQAIAEWLQANW